MPINEDTRKNASGYSDPTAHEAITNVDREQERFNKLLGAIFTICELSGFHVEERMVIKDKKTGRIWRQIILSIEYMRKSISKIYPGEKWKRKVSSMPDYQVMAIYDSFYKSGKFEEYDRLESARKKLRNKARIDRTKLLTKCDSRDNEKK